MSRVYNEEVELGKSDTHGIDRGKEEQWKTAHSILCELEQMNSGTVLSRNNRNTMFIKCYKGKEMLQSHYRLRLDGTLQEE